MKNIRRIFYISAVLSVAFTLLTAVISCGNPFSAHDNKESSGVIIRIAGSDGRTILPNTPIFSKYELFLQKDDAEQTQIENTEGIELSGVELKLSEGNWTITLKAYQDIFKDGVGVLAAVGSDEITVNEGEGIKTVFITLKPIPIKEASDIPGLFSFDITLPQGVQEAVLKLENEGGYNEEFNLMGENSGSIQLDPGYYDMSVILKKNGQNAGLFESVHIYSGLESRADIDLSGIVFADKVYLKGTLAGVRLGSIQILDENKTLIKELNLDNEDKAERTADWFTDIPSSNIGKQVYITQEFNGEEATVEISPQAAGKDGIVLALIPDTPEFTNIATWYSKASASDGENPQLAADGKSETFWDISSGSAWLELDYGFNVTVNDVEVIFSDGTNPAGRYSVDYWNGTAWIQAISRSLTGTKEYGGFFKDVTASKFRLYISDTSGSAAIAEFGLSRTTGRVPQVLHATGSYHEVTLTWKEAQKADAYNINYKYTIDGGDWLEAATVTADDCVRDASNNLTYSFMPSGHNNAKRAGLELQFMVEAVNNTTTDCIASENDVRAKLIGPALLSPLASAAASVNDITLSWDKVEGAGGYYVFRRQFNMDNTAQEGTTVIAYYVPHAQSGPIAVTGKGLASGADTTTVKAAASVTGSRFTLTDTWMTDAEYNGSTYNGYGTYRDQQNDMAQGKPYRYFIVPVLANEPLASISYTGAAYTLQDVNVTNAASLEKTGFTVGFGQNVTATKGSYASTGNVNNGIQITWEKPPLLTGSPQYTIYRKAPGGSWESIATTSDTQYVSTNETRGTVYEYAIGVTGSRPDTSERFLSDSRAQLDGKGIPKPFGFMLEMVKLQSVSREAITVNGQFGENITLVKNTDQNYIKGIDGYTVYVMNRNINAIWHTIRDNVAASDVDTTIQVATGMGSVTIPNPSDAGKTLTFDMLRVMRDYKHYFKVRSYVLNDGVKMYCPDPAYTYSNVNAAGSAQTDYVKWGARQITSTEFAKIAMVHMCDGIDQVNGTAWNTGYFGKSANADGTGTSGKISADSNFGVTSWDFNFQNYKTDLQVRTGERLVFLTINGKLWAGTSKVNNYPNEWGYNKDIDITGPTDTPGLYTGKMAIGGGTQRGGSVYYNDLTWSAGDISVKYPAGTTAGSTANPATDQKIAMTGENTPMLFSGKGNQRYMLEDYK